MVIDLESRSRHIVPIQSPRGMAPPVIVRLAGLPVRALAPLASTACTEPLQARARLEGELAGARRAVVATIEKELPRFAPATRRLLLAVKRSCFNGREIGAYRARVEWAGLLSICPHDAERVVALEAQLRETDRWLATAYDRELARERLHVLKLVQDGRFLRGIALGRPGLAQKIRAHAPRLASSQAWGGPAKWEQSLLRFVTRAATKLSANSTLTTYALGSVQPPPTPAHFRFLDAPLRESSLVRINRPELEQLQELLMQHPAVRDRSFVAWNDSVEELEPDRYRFLRTGHWELAPGGEGFRYVRPARVTLQLSNPLLAIARDALRHGRLEYRRLIDLAEGEPSATRRRSLDQLVNLGALLLVPPWPAHETRLEERMREFLGSLPDEDGLRSAADALDELLALEDGFAAASRPEESIFRIREAFSRLLDAVNPHPPGEGRLTSRAQLYEDVHIEAASGDDPSVFHVAPPVVEEVLHTAGLVQRFAGLFNHRHDVLHTLAAWWQEQQPHRRTAPFLEVARQFAPLWQQFLHFQRTANQSALETFDPLHRPVLQSLRDRRRALLSQADALLHGTPTLDSLPRRPFEALVEALPQRYAPLVGPCVFVQPASSASGLWVLNHLHEGLGQYLSRVTPLLGRELQQRWLDRLAARPVVTPSGERADFLEVIYPWGTLVNIHPPQALKVLDLSGLHLDLPENRRVGLDQLMVHIDSDRESFRLTDASGRRLLPVNLSSMAAAGFPPLLRLLLAFGPGETRNVFPFAHAVSRAEMTTFNRLTCGRLILRRRRWAILVQPLRAELDGLAAARAYTHLHRWRQRLDLPPVAFYYETTYQGLVKPQLVAFDSPSLCDLFLASIKRMSAEHLMLEEALPSPFDFPCDPTGNRRGLELMIDSIVLHAADGNHFAAVPSYDREPTAPRKEAQDA